MSLSQEQKALYYNMFRPDRIRQLMLPAGAAVVAAANAAGSTYGAWVNIALPAAVLVDSLIVGVFAANPSATDEFTIDIGSAQGYANAAAVIAAGAAAILAAHRQEVAYDYHQVTAVGVLATTLIPLRFPIFIPAGVGILARIYGVTAAAVTLDIRVAVVQNFK